MDNGWKQNRFSKSPCVSSDISRTSSVSNDCDSCDTLLSKIMMMNENMKGLQEHCNRYDSMINRLRVKESFRSMEGGCNEPQNCCKPKDYCKPPDCCIPKPPDCCIPKPPDCCIPKPQNCCIPKPQDCRNVYSSTSNRLSLRSAESFSSAGTNGDCDLCDLLTKDSMNDYGDPCNPCRPKPKRKVTCCFEPPQNFCDPCQPSGEGKFSFIKGFIKPKNGRNGNGNGYDFGMRDLGCCVVSGSSSSSSRNGMTKKLLCCDSGMNGKKKSNGCCFDPCGGFPVPPLPPSLNGRGMCGGGSSRRRDSCIPDECDDDCDDGSSMARSRILESLTEDKRDSFLDTGVDRMRVLDSFNEPDADCCLNVGWEESRTRIRECFDEPTASQSGWPTSRSKGNGGGRSDACFYDF